MSKLDKDFKETVKLINAKLKEAADAVNEANRLSEAAGLPGLIWSQWTQDDISEDIYEDVEEMFGMIDVSDLEDALDNSGWSTSSSYC